MALFGGMADYASKGTIQLLAEVLIPTLIGLAVLLWLGIWRPRAKGMISKKTTRDEQVIMQLYGRMLRHLAQKGIAKLMAMPPLEFVRLTQERWNSASSAVASITDLYCRARFGHIPLTREELALAESHLRDLMTLDKP
jgi:protein-glutamine gamma-glutamyltransferase